MHTNLQKVISITTPEGAEFSLYPASPLLRAVALLIDFSCIIVTVNLLMLLVRALAVINDNIANALGIVLTLVMLFGYYIAIEWLWDGRSVGKRIFHLRVIDRDGLKLSLPQIMLRNILRIVDAIPLFYVVGGVASFLTPGWQRLGDIAAGTMVIRELDLAQPDLSKIVPDRYNSLREYPYFAAQARNAITPDEAELVFEFLKRRDELQPEIRVKLCRQLAEYFRQLVDFPAEALENLSDERYLRNLVDILYNSAAAGHSG